MSQRNNPKQVSPTVAAKWLKLIIAVLNAILSSITTAFKRFRK